MTARRFRLRWTLAVLALAAACALALAACAGAGAAAAQPRPTTAADEQAAYDKVISADDGMTVEDPLRNERLIATGDATMVDGIDYSRSWGYPHMVFVAQTGPAAFAPLRLYESTVPNHYGWQPVPDSACPIGKVFWAGGLLYAPGARQVVDYGACVNPADGTGHVGEIATFDAATLRFEGLRATGTPESLADAVPAPGGWWLPGSRFGDLSGASYADMAWVPAGDQNRPWDWRWTRDVVPNHMLPGNVFSVFTWGGRWLALVEPGDMYAGLNAVELTAPGPRGPWTPTGKFWPLRLGLANVYAYSVVAHGALNGQLVMTFATACMLPPAAGPCPLYRLNFEGVSP